MFLFFEKNAYNTIPINGNRLTSIFFDDSAKISCSKNFMHFEIARKIFCFFFERKSNFVLKQTFFKRQKFAC